MSFTSKMVVACLLGLAVSAPAQVGIGFRIGSGLSIGDVFSTPRRPVLAPRGHGVGPLPAIQSVVWPAVRTVCPDRVFVPAYYRHEYRPPEWGWILYGCGRRRWGIVRPGGTIRVFVPGHWERKGKWIR
ncbi:MAG: hypothetical protein Fur0037_03850 [Planctomycetota bacterium]